MNFQNGNNRVDVYINENKIFINGILHNISKVLLNGETYSRFKFEPGSVDVKITNDILSYNDGSGTKTFMLIKNLGLKEQLVKEFTEYIVTTGLKIGIDGGKSLIRFNDVDYNITATRKNGIYTLYESSIGILSLSSDVVTRPDMWNNIVIQKTT